MPSLSRLCYNKNMKRKAHGFTLIELALSLIFIAILSVTVVLLIQNVTASYRRGLVLNQINTIGMDLIDDFRSSVQNASSYPITEMCNTFYSEGSNNRNNCLADNASSFVTVTKRATVRENGAVVGNGMPVYGAFCTGTYTYIWNSGYFESVEYSTRSVTYGSNTLSPASLNMVGLGVKSGFRLLKVYDAERTVCVNAMKAQDISAGGANYVPLDSYDYGRVPAQFTLDQSMVVADAGSDSEGGVELMKKNELSDLVLYDLYVAKPALSATRKNFFFSSSFILGTRRGGINIKQAGNSCKPPSDDYSELEYCAINKFNFAVQAGGE